MEVYEIQLKPRALEITATEEAKFTSVVDYLQQIAYEHAFNLGLSFQQTFKQNLTWYLLRYYIVMNRYPKLDELITVRSWVARSDTKYTLREFQILDQSDEILCAATTSWLLFNFVKRRQVDHVKYFSYVPIRDNRAVDYGFPKLVLPEKVDSKAEIRVRLSDLDLNNHVNNRVYIDWALESMPSKYLKNYQISKIEISFKGQAFHKDKILVETELKKGDEKGEVLALSKISNMKSGNLLTKMISYWMKKH
jgi:medium-chain acyl-[acyl-carrier-protein] hydrolase